MMYVACRQQNSSSAEGLQLQVMSTNAGELGLGVCHVSSLCRLCPQTSVWYYRLACAGITKGVLLLQQSVSMQMYPMSSISWVTCLRADRCISRLHSEIPTSTSPKVHRFPLICTLAIGPMGSVSMSSLAAIWSRQRFGTLCQASQILQELNGIRWLEDCVSEPK